MLAALFLQLLVALCFGPAVAFPFRLRVPGRGYNATSPGNTTTVTAQCISPLTTGSADAYMGHSLNCSGKPYFPERYTCWDGYRLCPRGARACGTDRITYDCYYSSQYRCVSGTLQQVPGGFGTVTATYGNSSAVRTAAYLSEPAATPDAPTGNATVPYVTSTPPYCGEDEERPLFY